MIIEERGSNKLPTLTSIFFKLDYYNSDVFMRLVQSKDSIYDSATSEFEFPLNRLVFVVDTLIGYGNITVKLLNEKPLQISSCSDYKFKLKPYRHQLEGVEYGLSRNNGWLLLDEQGLGKTATIIYLAQILKEREQLEHCFIICGVNGLKYNWKREIETFSNLDCRILGEKISKKGRVTFSTLPERCKELEKGIKEFFIVTNIETLRSADFIKSYNKFSKHIDMIVLDEAHKCKDPQSKSAKTLLKMKAKRCIALTGTLIVNVPENSFIPLKWTNNTKSTYTQFKHMYNEYGGFGNKQVIGYRNLDLLQELIESCSLRRLKSEVLDLPEKVYINEYVELGTEQRALYDKVEDSILSDLDKIKRVPTIIEEITLNMRLRQITASPSIISSSVTQSAKLDRLCELASTIISQGDKLVVFCSFIETANEIIERLSEYNCVLTTGNTDAKTADDNERIFQSDNNVKVYVATWQKCGTGRTLTAANYLIFIDTPWTDADFQQSADRIHRIGQKQPSFIITLIAKDTYDERVLEILNTKKDLSGVLIKSEEHKISEKNF